MTSAPQSGKPDYIGLVLAICAVAMTVMVGYRQFGPAPQSQPTGGPPVRVSDFNTLTEGHPEMGPRDAPVVLMEFTDFECPVCASYARTVEEIRKRYSRDVRVVIAHFPLTGHRFAMRAARAAECAAAQGRFEAMYSALFQAQDSFGLKSWVSYGVAAGVPDTAKFASCAASADPMPRVERGRALARELGITGTPTVLVNGWKWPGFPPTDAELDSIVRAAKTDTQKHPIR